MGATPILSNAASQPLTRLADANPTNGGNMKIDKVIGGVVALLLGACADKNDIASRLDAHEVDVSDTVGEVTPDGTTSETTSPDGTTGETIADGTSEVETVAPDTVGETSDTTPTDTNVSDTAGDTTVTPWEVDPDSPWALGRPIPISGSEGAASVGTPVNMSGRYKALVPVGIGSGAVVADGRSFGAPDAGGHAVIVALSGDLLAPALGTVVYLDGPLSAPERPSLAFCDNYIYATINEQNGSASRLVRLSADLESIDVAAFTAIPGLGHSVKLGPPICGGPGFVVTLDAVGGASFTGPDGKKSEFNSTQTENKTLIVNGTRVFAENSAQVVSATSMRILQLVRGVGKVVFYIGEATAPRTIGDTMLQPGDQLVYNHDYALGTGGSIASQGWFGREDISLLATAPDGRFAVAWVDVTAGATANDPELVEIVVSVFEASGARAWNKRSAAWAIDRISFDADGDLRIAGRFRSLEAIGVATAPVGLEDAFLAVLGGADGARKRHVVLGVPGIATTLVGPVFDALGSGECAAAGALDAIITATGPTRVAIGVGETARCATQALTAGDGLLQLGAATVPSAAPDATEFWLAFGGPALGGAHGTPWPAANAQVGPVRARFVSPL